jgi:GH18 family chitinase/aryl-phospho-beta-D-glucosidase BglC (GH1 family)
MQMTLRGARRLLWCCVLAVAMVAVISTQAAAYTVEDGRVRDGDGNSVQLQGVSWFGFETDNHVVHGLWTRNWKDMIAQIRDLGFNSVRIPFCPGTLRGVTTSSIDTYKNPELAGKNSLEILDMVVEEFDRNGIHILMDHHRPDCQSISTLWYVEGYSERQWIDDLVFVADRYSNLDFFMGIDLKNEPHGDATWGTGNAATDWDGAAERAAAEILAANPNILIFVEGIESNPVCTGDVGHWWGGNLEPLNCAPLDIPMSQLVLSPHVYGPDVFAQPYFNDSDFPENMPAIWDAHFGQFHEKGYAIAIGEYGGRYGNGGDPRDKVWQNAFVDYMIDRGMGDAYYWSFNPNSSDTGGILQDDWTTVHEDKMQLLNRFWAGGSSEPACADGIDNDGDGLIDMNDPGCRNSSDVDEENPLTQDDKVVIGYFPAWGIYYDYFPKDIDGSKITHINYAFINVRDNQPVLGVTERGVADSYADYQRSISAAESVDGIGDTYDQALRGNFNQMRKLKEKHPHVKVLVALGGWTWSAGFSDAALPENREAFVSSVIDTLILGNLPYDAVSRTGGAGSAAGVFDGIDIDWEYPVGGGLGGNINRPEDKENFTALLAEFRRQLDEIDPDLLLTIAAPAGPSKIVNHEIEKFPQYLDFVNLMAYDYHGDWDASTGLLAPIYPASDDPAPIADFTMHDTVQTYLELGIPRDKLVLGLPFYGRSWSGVAPGPNGDGLYQRATGAGPGERDEPGMLNYKTIMRDYAGSYTKHTHPESQVPYLYNGNIFITYDDPETILRKVDYILDEDLAGAMFWNLMSDIKGNPASEDSLLATLDAGLGGVEPSYQCSDGIDNDGDGLVDMGDPGCESATDIDETDEPEPPAKACADGIDNDGDGLVDMSDPGCTSASDDDEFNDPEPIMACADELDNDGDGLVDANDPGCVNATDDDEYNAPPSPDEDLSVELRSTANWETGYCSDVIVSNNGSSSVDWAIEVGIEGTISDLWSADYVQDGSTLRASGVAWNRTLAPGASTSFGFCAKRAAPPPPTPKACADGIDNDGDGLVDMSDPGCASATDDDEFNAPPKACADGTDNDGDGLVDMNDPGCTSATDDDEFNAPPKACADGIDNDGDGLVDMSDPGCASATDDDEFNAPEPTQDVVVTRSVASDWGSGYCENIRIKNVSNTPIDWETTFSIDGSIYNSWSANYSQNGQTVSANGVGWNNILQPGRSTEIGFCANR